MPYPPKQASAVFLNVKRKQGMAAARAFAKKHMEVDNDGDGTRIRPPMKRNTPDAGNAPYRPRSRRAAR